MNLEDLIERHKKIEDNFFDYEAIRYKTAYHYTSTSNAQKIISVSDNYIDFRFTEARFLNDPDEIVHGLQIFEKVYQERISSAGGSSSSGSRAFMERVRNAVYNQLIFENDDVVKFYEEKQISGPLSNLYMRRHHSPSLYLASFSFDEDDLGQWVAYAANGTGVAIGIACDLRSHDEAKDNNHIFRLPVTYGMNDGKLAEISASIDAVFAETRDFNPMNSAIDFTPEPTGTFLLIVQHFMRMITSLKSEAYAREREFRLAVLRPSEHSSGFVEGRGNILKPYVVEKLSTVPVQSYTIGPAIKNILNVQSHGASCKHLGCRFGWSKLNYNG